MFRVGQIIYPYFNERARKEIGYFYIVEKICPKTIEVRFYFWDSYNNPHQWRKGISQSVEHQSLSHCAQATKIDFDSHIFHVNTYV